MAAVARAARAIYLRREESLLMSTSPYVAVRSAACGRLGDDGGDGHFRWMEEAGTVGRWCHGPSGSLTMPPARQVFLNGCESIKD